MTRTSLSDSGARTRAGSESGTPVGSHSGTTTGSGPVQLAMPMFVAPEGPAQPTPDRSAWQRAMLTSGLRPATKLVALAVSVHEAPPGTAEALVGIAACAPGLAALVDEVGYSRSHVLRQIRLLREHGWLMAARRPAPGRSTVYGLMLPARTSPPPRPARIVSTAPARSASHRRAGRGRIPAAALDTLITPNRRGTGLVDLLDRRAAATSPTTPPGPSDRSARTRTAPEPAPTDTAVAEPTVTDTADAAVAEPTDAERRAEHPAPSSTTGWSAAAQAASEAPTIPITLPVPQPAPTPTPTATAPPAPTPTPTATATVRQTPIPGTSAPAAAQVLAALARALRCEPAVLDHFGTAVCAVLDAGAWPAVDLAAHLADGVALTVAEPAALIGRRLDELPPAPEGCGCRPCQSLHPTPRPGRAATKGRPAGPTEPAAETPPAPAQRPARRVSRLGRPSRRRPAPAPAPTRTTTPTPATPDPAPAPATGPAASGRPDLAEIERAAAAGTAQARLRRDHEA